MTKRILLFTVIFQMLMISAGYAAREISSQKFNELIDETTTEQVNTAHLLWNAQRVKDYIRKKRTLQTTKMMVADSTSATQQEDQ